MFVPFEFGPEAGDDARRIQSDTGKLLMVLGMIQTGDLAWLGALILGLLALFFLWLLLLSWPAIPASGRMLRGIVVVALAGAAVLKALGRL